MPITLVASAARTTSGNQALTGVHVELATSAIFMLDVTAAATDAGDTLNVYLQSSHDNTVWDDFVSFTTVLGNGGAKQFIAKWFKNLTPEREIGAPQDAAMAAGGVNQGPLGQFLRAKWVIVDSGTVNVSFTFSVSLQPVYR